ncbi:ornithine cyclodeaminase family protein [Paraburkholderia sp. RCC_158]|uniref:ornithine cyclodeaminase family protein n=1 Tax=Paraburkholderia sp. RCC_158 TaxID=3239220 RepID=UPI0035240556
MKVLTKDEIMRRFDPAKALALIEAGLIAHACGDVQLPPVQNFRFVASDGDCCVKSAYVEGQPAFFVKVSTGFYRNAEHGLPTNDGLVLALSATTGEPLVLLQDQGWLTGIRTALAGAIVARLLAPVEVRAIGIVGTGEQARLQLRYLASVVPCRKAIVWGRSAMQLEAFRADAARLGYDVRVTLDAEKLARSANLIVTTTASRAPILRREWIQRGTHVTAVGADAPGKQELDAAIVGDADCVVVDSLKQCAAYGELAHAIAAGLRAPDDTVELGSALAVGRRVRGDDRQITVADLTGLAVQDAAAAACVLDAA